MSKVAQAKKAARELIRRTKPMQTRRGAEIQQYESNMPDFGVHDYVVDMRHVGSWTGPVDGGWDFVEPTDETWNQLNEILTKVQENYPELEMWVDCGEKEWVHYTIRIEG